MSQGLTELPRIGARRDPAAHLVQNIRCRRAAILL
jgi:hypothetical protein